MKEELIDQLSKIPDLHVPLRATDGYIVWSEAYDRPEGDKLWIQEDIANEVSKALRASIR